MMSPGLFRWMVFIFPPRRQYASDGGGNAVTLITAYPQHLIRRMKRLWIQKAHVVFSMVKDNGSGLVLEDYPVTVHFL